MIKVYLWQLPSSCIDQLEHGEVILLKGELHYVEWVTSDCLVIHVV